MKIVWISWNAKVKERKRKPEEIEAENVKNQAVHSKSTIAFFFVKEIVMWAIFKQKENKMQKNQRICILFKVI